MLQALKSAWKSFRFTRSKSSSKYPPPQLAVEPDNDFQLGNAAMAREDLTQALEHYGRYVAKHPHIAKGYVGLGYALSEQGHWAQAIEALQQAVEMDASSAGSYFMLGRAYWQQHELQAAENAWARAHLLDPQLEPLYGDYGLLLFKNGKIQQALALMEAGIARFPQNSQLQFYLGNLLAEMGNYAMAAQRYRAAVKLGDLSPGLFDSMGAVFIQLGLHDEAIEVLQKAKALAPDSATAASNYLLAIQYGDKLSKAEKFAVAQAFAERFERPLRSLWGNYHCCDDEPGRKLRIGYVSGDFRTHSLAFFFEPIVANHDRSKVEVFCYYTHPLFDAVSQRIRAQADHWVSCHDMSDEELAARIRADEIDVLVDLSGHTGHNRMLTFARKPAPVQMTWLGYQATTGLQAMDYRITDEGLDPIGTSEQFHSEKLIRLFASGTFSPSPESPPVNELPALSGKPFTFGCLNNPSKITDKAIALWAQILVKTPESRLMIGNATPALIDRLSAQFEKLGVTVSRLVFQPKVSLAEYLALHHQIDLALDTFPYNGGTTTFHALWMGVPIIALDGESSLSKVGAAVMRGMGLGQLCAETMEQYVEYALYFSRHLRELAVIRQSLRATAEQVNQQLAVAVTRSLEDAMQSCLQAYCDKA